MNAALKHREDTRAGRRSSCSACASQVACGVTLLALTSFFSVSLFNRSKKGDRFASYARAMLGAAQRRDSLLQALKGAVLPSDDPGG